MPSLSSRSEYQLLARGKDILYRSNTGFPNGLGQGQCDQRKKGLTQTQLDFLVDAQSNSIGALLMHLAATDAIYQDLTFYGLKDFSPVSKTKFWCGNGTGRRVKTNKRP